MDISPFIQTDINRPYYGTHSVPVAISTRIRLARNFKGHIFPIRANYDQRKEVLEYALKGAQKTPQLKDAHLLPIQQLSELQRQILIERNCMSKDLSRLDYEAALLITKDQSLIVMVNEEDHVRMQTIAQGLQLKQSLKRLSDLDDSFSNQVKYAFSNRWGYLTTCPTNVGTGMRASVMMHLPGLYLIGQIEKVIRAVNQLGIAVRGFSGEGSEASGSIFQISNQQTLGASESQILKRLNSVVESLIEQEENARQRLIEKDPHKLMDKMSRALGTLKFSYILSASDATNMLSFVRLAVDVESLPSTLRNRVDSLLVQVQPGHIQQMKGLEGKVESRTRDVIRAEFLREALKDVHDLKTVY